MKNFWPAVGKFCFSGVLFDESIAEAHPMSRIGQEQLSWLLDRYGRALVLYARQWCAEPEDVVQEAFVKLVCQPTAPENPAAWLFQMVRHGAISAARSARRRASREQQVAAHRKPWFELGDDAQFGIHKVTQALESLSEEIREAVIARLWGGLSFEDIAHLTGCSTSTAHRRYHTGLETLREKLQLCPRTQKHTVVSSKTA